MGLRPRPDHYFLALNHRMTDLQGAVARAQLNRGRGRPPPARALPKASRIARAHAARRSRTRPRLLEIPRSSTRSSGVPTRSARRSKGACSARRAPALPVPGTDRRPTVPPLPVVLPRRPAAAPYIRRGRLPGTMRGLGGWSSSVERFYTDERDVPRRGGTQPCPSSPVGGGRRELRGLLRPRRSTDISGYGEDLPPAT